MFFSLRASQRYVWRREKKIITQNFQHVGENVRLNEVYKIYTKLAQIFQFQHLDFKLVQN